MHENLNTNYGKEKQSSQNNPADTICNADGKPCQNRRLSEVRTVDFLQILAVGALLGVFLTLLFSRSKE
ncbi:MAG TPA: hypothetical protein VI757_01635 [Bacteroidia bacterium]|nr:hypothetical protein [Bacteroidia bacterium]